MLGVSLGRFVKGLARLEERRAPTEDVVSRADQLAESGPQRERRTHPHSRVEMSISRRQDRPRAVTCEIGALLWAKGQPIRSAPKGRSYGRMGNLFDRPGEGVLWGRRATYSISPGGGVL